MRRRSNNSYCLARMMQSDKPDDMSAISKVGYVWSNQNAGGVYINISGIDKVRFVTSPGKK